MADASFVCRRSCQSVRPGAAAAARVYPVASIVDRFLEDEMEGDDDVDHEGEVDDAVDKKLSAQRASEQQGTLSSREAPWAVRRRCGRGPRTMGLRYWPSSRKATSTGVMSAVNVSDSTITASHRGIHVFRRGSITNPVTCMSAARAFTSFVSFILLLTNSEAMDMRSPL